MTPRPRRLVISDHAFRQLLDLRDAIFATSGSQETADGYMRALHAYFTSCRTSPCGDKRGPISIPVYAFLDSEALSPSRSSSTRKHWL